MTNDPIKMTPEQAAKAFSAFEDETAGLDSRQIVEFMSYLLYTDGLRLLDRSYQAIAASFIASGVLDFDGNIHIDLDEINEYASMLGKFSKTSQSPFA